MSWIATIKEVNKEVHIANIVVQFTDGQTITTINYRTLDMESLKNMVRQQIAQYESLELEDFPLGEMDLSLPEAPIPTTKEQQQEQFLKDYVELQQYQKALDKGLIKSDNVQYTTLQVKVKTTWKEEYVPLINGLRV